jgi:L,D-peptidoglycan transpeptidase YkuD (ErfK/YbiS/YcfS/YnhG family)
MPVRVVICALAAASLLTACTSDTSGGADRSTPVAPTSTIATPTPSAPSTTPRSAPVRKPTTPRSAPVRKPTTAQAGRLPLGYSTGAADQVITVVASAQSDAQATLQAWRKVAGGWHRVGPSVPAWLGADGMTPNPSEQVSAVPMGSYTLTQAFGFNTNPGTALQYVHTTPADWWISEPGPLYNTMQHCSSDCAFTQGDPNEHLYYETPPYNYAVIINYNRRPVHQGAGSAFFLHVSVGAPTAGCVSIDQTQLVRIMQWLEPSKHPRIVIGTD